MRVWESTFEIYEYSWAIPETVGAPEDVLMDGIPPAQKEFTPRPKCKEYGYTAFEWIWHWAGAVSKAVRHPNKNEVRQNAVYLLRRRENDGSAKKTKNLHGVR